MPDPRASACCGSRPAPPDDALLAAAESVAAQIAHVRGRCGEHRTARRRAMLDVAFDSVVTMDDRGVVLAVNRAAERTVRLPRRGHGRARGGGADHPASRCARRTGTGSTRYLRTGRGPVVGRRVELTAMRARRDRVPGRARRHPARRSPAPPVFYGYLRDLTARYVAEAALHRLADEQAALRRVATAVAAERDPARLFALVGEEVGRLLEAQTAHMFRFDADGRGGTIVGGWALRPEHVLPPGHAHAARRRHGGRRACGAPGARRGWTTTRAPRASWRR